VLDWFDVEVLVCVFGCLGFVCLGVLCFWFWFLLFGCDVVVLGFVYIGAVVGLLVW